MSSKIECPVCIFCENTLDAHHGRPITKSTRPPGKIITRSYDHVCNNCYKSWYQNEKQFWKDNTEPDVTTSTSSVREELDLEMQHKGSNHQVRFYRADVNHAWSLVARPRFEGKQFNYRKSTYLPIQTNAKTRKSHLFPCQIILLSDFPDIRTAKVHADLRLCLLYTSPSPRDY